jgi:hypothetical protein
MLVEQTINIIKNIIKKLNIIMPISRKAGEDKESFISRCIAKEISSGKSNEQAAAICYNIWEGGYNEPPVSVEFKKKVLISEDTSDEVILDYIKSGFKPHILSKRKIRRRDKKVYNRLKRLGLNSDIDLKFGDVKTLYNEFKYDAIVTDDNPLIVMLESMGRPLSDYKVLKSVGVSSLEEATKSLELVKDIDLRFITVKTVFTYELRPEFSGQGEVIPTTRDFCRRIIGLNKAWTIDEIQSISGEHLKKMGLPDDVFTFTGGFYRRPGTTESTPFCRHQWQSKIVIEQ